MADRETQLAVGRQSALPGMKALVHEASDGQVLGQCYTPLIVARKIVRMLPDVLDDVHSLRFLEPSAGRGSFVVALKERFPNCEIDVMDIDPQAPVFTEPELAGLVSRSVHGDFLTTKPPSEHYEWVIGNPPYSIIHEDPDGSTRSEEVATEHVRRALEMVRGQWLGGVTQLLRMAFFGGRKHLALFEEKGFPKTADVAVPRIPFYGQGTDKYENAVFTWTGERVTRTSFGVMEWKT